MNYARIIDNVAAEVVSFDPILNFTPEVAAMFSAVPEDVCQGWLLEGETWVAPPVPVPVEPTPPPVVYPKPSPIEFKLLFLSSERVAIATLAKTDPYVEDMLSILSDPTLPCVDLNLASNQAYLSYLVTHGIINSTRQTQILEGVAQ